MSSFTAPLIIEVLLKERRGRGIARLVQGFTYDVGYLGSGETITVPAGYETDFTSVPRIVRVFISNFGQTSKAAVLHDWLIDQPFIANRYANDVFYEALLVSGVARWKARLLWLAVRIRY